jgi:hypothetical protein
MNFGDQAMSDYQPNFSTGPVIDASCTEASEFVQEKQLLVSQINKYGGCTEAAAACLDKMSGLAKQFNHRTVGVPHLIIAMTLVPNAIRAFQARDISADIAFRSAMLSLIDMQRVEPGKPLAETSSDELLGVLKRARDIAKNRDDQPVSVHDLLTALDGLPPDSPAAEPIRGGGKNGYVHAMKAELQNIVTSFAMQIREVMPQIQPQVFDLQISREFADLRGYLQSRDGALERLLVSQIGELRNSMPPERAPEPAAGANENAARDGAQPGWLQNVFGSGAR